MKIRSRLTAVVLVLCMLLFVCYQGISTGKKGGNTSEENSGNHTLEAGGRKTTLYVWYTDEALTDYMNSCALSFMEQNAEIRVVPTLVSAVEYLENINDASMRGEAAPDVYLVTNDCLEKAYMAGLATPITDPESLVTEEVFPDTALKAVSCDGQRIAYPFYYETSLFLYNRTYLDTMAATKAEALKAQSEAQSGEGDSTNAQTEEGQTQEEPIPTGADDLIPATMDDILSLADAYDAPEGVEAILKWDVSDIFYNYFFAGNYLNVGGEAGDDASVVDIYNTQSVACMQLYQSLNQFFSIEAKESSYDQVLQEFMEGKTLFTVATTDAIAKLEQAKSDGTIQWEYGIATLPDVSSELKSRGLSVTNTAVINGYSQQKEQANAFASYLTCHADSTLYERAGKLASAKNVSYSNPKLRFAMAAYEKSASLPKIMEASNFWVQLEVAYTGIWQGEDADTVMKNLDEQIRGQLAE